MRLLARTTEEVQPVYEMMVMGGNIAKALLPEIEKLVGETTQDPQKKSKKESEDNKKA